MTKIGGYIIIKAAELPFHKDVHRLIEKHPEYLEGIRRGVVHIGFNPGQREIMKPKATAVVNFPQAAVSEVDE